MGGMTGEIVFVMLIVGIVCVAWICMRGIRERESKLEEMEKKRLMEEISQSGKESSLSKTLVSKVLEVTDSVTKVFMPEDSDTVGTRQVEQMQELSEQQTETEGVEELRGKLLEVEQKLWEIESKSGYEKFFHRVVMPLQVLLGLSAVSLDTLGEERAVYYIWEVIANPLIQAVEQANGTVENGKLMLSLSKGKFDSGRVKKEIEGFGKNKLENYIKENEQRLELGAVVFQKVGVVQGLGGILEEIRGLEQNCLVEENVVHGLAQRLLQLFEENRIYPMFADDRRLVSYPELRKRFIPLNENSIRYPGLFIEREGVLEVFGSNIGMN